MGHALDETLQDILIRYKRMQGYNALWVPGTDHASISTEVLPNESRHFQYIARVKYVENHFESVAATKEEALKGPFHRVKSRRLTEIARYVKGAWSL